MVEDATGLGYIKDEVAKRAEEIIFHAEWEKSVLKSVSNRISPGKDIKYVLLFQNKLSSKSGPHMPVSVMFGNSSPPTGRCGYLSWWHLVNTK